MLHLLQSYLLHSDFKSINGLNHSLCQRPYDPIVSGNTPFPNLVGISQSNEVEVQKLSITEGFPDTWTHPNISLSSVPRAQTPGLSFSIPDTIHLNLAVEETVNSCKLLKGRPSWRPARTILAVWEALKH